jgi:hypothetical protein
MPAVDNLKRITEDGYKLLKGAVREEKDVIKHFDKIRIISFTTDADTKERVTKGEQIEALCSVDFQDAPDNLFSVELFYMMDSGSKFKIIPMEPLSGQKTVILYRCVFEVEGFGIQNLNVRVKPADEIVRDLHPELVKWKE